MDRRPLIAGNWKMHKVTSEAVAFAKELKRTVAAVEGTDILIAPPYVHILPLCAELAGSNVLLAAQNVCHELQGAFTGEVSAIMLKEAGCSHVIIGHSERRHIYRETDDLINRKVKIALQQGLIPILCIGETLEERQADQTFEVVAGQLLAGLDGVPPEQLTGLLVAYEPVWAIGTGLTATPDQAGQVHVRIRELAGKNFGAEMAAGLRILYGGSVKPDNIEGLITIPDIDGALVGGACLQMGSFTGIISCVEAKCASI